LALIPQILSKYRLKLLSTPDPLVSDPSQQFRNGNPLLILGLRQTLQREPYSTDCKKARLHPNWLALCLLLTLAPMYQLGRLQEKFSIQLPL